MKKNPSDVCFSNSFCQCKFESYCTYIYISICICIYPYLYSRLAIAFKFNAATPKKSYMELFNSEMHTMPYLQQLQIAWNKWEFPTIRLTLLYEQVHQKAADYENVTYLCKCFIYSVIPLTISF